MDSPSPPGLSDAARQQLILLVLEIAGSLHSVTVLPPRSDGDSTGSDEEPSYVYTAFMLFVTVRLFWIDSIVHMLIAILTAMFSSNISVRFNFEFDL